jgi:hypothetical protein
MKRRWKSHVGSIFWLVIVLTYLLRVGPGLFQLTSSWDDPYSLYFANLAAQGDWSKIFVDFHMIPYNLALAAWVFLWGPTMAAGKSLSILIGLSFFYFSFRLAERLFGTYVAYFSVAVLSTSPAVIAYSTEVRGYILTMAAAAATFLFYSELKEKMTLRNRWHFIFAATVCAYAHVAGVIFLMGLFINDLLLYPTLNSRWKTRVMDSVKLFLPTLLIYSPVFYFVATFPKDIASLYFWVPTIKFKMIGGGFAHVAGSWWALGTIAPVIFAAFLVRRFRSNVHLQFATLILFPVCILLLASYLLQHPVFIFRGLVSSIPFMMILFSAAVVDLTPRRNLQLIVVGALILVNIFAPTRFFLQNDYSQAIRILDLESRIPSARPILYHNWFDRYTVAYYFASPCFHDHNIEGCLVKNGFLLNQRSLYKNIRLAAMVDILDIYCRSNMASDIRNHPEFRSNYVSIGKKKLGHCITLESYYR